MKLSILMPALRWRRQRMRPLIEAQIAGRHDVEFLVDEDGGEMPSGAKRQRLLERACGAYVAFVDDDDEVATTYVREIVARCDATVDVITFRLDMLRAGKRAERWRLGLHPDDRARGRMSANHLCAWRRDLARAVSWCPALGYGDDQAWYGPLLASGLARREAHVPRPLYRYLWSADSTANQKPGALAAARDYWGEGLGCYRDDGGRLYVQCGGRQRDLARGPSWELQPIAALERYATVRLK